MPGAQPAPGAHRPLPLRAAAAGPPQPGALGRARGAHAGAPGGRVRSLRERGDLPQRPRPARHRDLRRPAAGALGRPGGRAHGHRSARSRRPARRARRSRDCTVRRPAPRHGDGARPPAGLADSRRGRVLPRPARLRPDGRVRRPGGVPLGRRLPPPRRRQHLAQRRRRAAAAGCGGAAPLRDRAARRRRARPAGRAYRRERSGGRGARGRAAGARPVGQRVHAADGA